MSEAPEKVGGIECPRCGCRHLPVVYTRQQLRRIKRVRECRHCGKRMATYEKLPIQEMPDGEDKAHDRL